MGCCHSKADGILTPETQNSFHGNHDERPTLLSSASPIHPCRLMEFNDESLKDRLLGQFIAGMNRNMNSPLQPSEQESCRRPDPRIMSLLTSNIIDEVEQELITDLATGILSIVVNGGSCLSYKAIAIKKRVMKGSQLGPVIIEAALTHIIDHLDEHPKLVAALGRAKIGYHDNGLMLEDVGTRVFVIAGSPASNADQ
jgi:hypothetical protein